VQMIIMYNVENRSLSLSDIDGVELNVSSETIVNNLDNCKLPNHILHYMIPCSNFHIV
jgi:hypothetical protein